MSDKLKQSKTKYAVQRGRSREFQHAPSPTPASCIKVTVDLQGPNLSKIIFYTKFKTSTLSEFSTKNYFKNLKRERVIHKNVNF